MKKQIDTLYTAFDKMNAHFYQGNVIRPTITIQTRGNAKAYGWCSVHPIWEGKEKTHEINISAEYANRPFMDIMGTLLHEIVHLNNIQNGIQDCSRGFTYHNAKFRDAAEAVGLIVTKSERYGYAHTAVSPELEAIINGFGLDKETFDTARIDFQTMTPVNGKDKDSGEDQDGAVNPKSGIRVKKSSSIRWKCGCGCIVRSTKEVNIMCGDCGTQFQKAA